MRPIAFDKLHKKKLKRFKSLAAIAVLILTIAVLSAVAVAPQRKESSSNSKPSQNPVAQFNKQQHSLNDPASTWVVVNKGRALPSDYVPTDLVTPNVPLRLSKGGSEMLLRNEAAHALENMFSGANKDSLSLMVASAYRPYRTQSGLYNGYVKKDGQANADLFSARPGHSEHQTGLAVDVGSVSRKCEIEQCFAETPEGKWVEANAYKHGFMIRYPKDKKSLTGYEYEPWHLRYVGVALAEQLYKTGQTLEQFFNLPSVSDYPAEIFQLKS